MLLIGTFFVVTPSMVRGPQAGDYTYTVNNGEATITGYTGAGGAITIPSTLGGYPTVYIGNGAFNGTQAHLITSVIIPDSVTTIGWIAFGYCSSLTSITFLGLVAPTSVGVRWIEGTNPGLLGHAYAASNFPAPGGVWNGLTMGTYFPASWWNTQWNYRKLLTIDSTKVSGTLVNFPILVKLIDNDLAAHAQSSGNDIVFILYSDNTTKLNHEIEYYDSYESTAVLYAWVNITRLSSTTNTKIWMYYGNPSAGPQQNKYGTWNSKYKAVYHLDETWTPYADSTSNKNNITSGNVAGGYLWPMGRPGGIRQWQEFNGTNNRFILPFSLSGAYTIEAIANTSLVASSEVLMSCGLTSSSPYPGVTMGISAVSNAILIGNGNREKALSPTATYVTAHTTHWWCDEYQSSSSLRFYLDGVSYTSSLSTLNFFNNAAGYNTIGARYYSGRYSMFWKGYIDEVRISSGNWNASWIKTCFNNEQNPAGFYSLGSQQQPS